jgi:hypothetical protein
VAFILIPNNGEDVKINAWNWRPTLELLHNAKVIDLDLYEGMATSGRRTIVDAGTAVRIADFLDERLRTMKAGDRIRADLTLTSEAKKPLLFTPGMKTDDIDVVDAYSATYEWLVRFSDFARTSSGFEVV